ncbi:hypothetical protein JCM5353_004643 [Sporobolomyces roseus]
MPHSPSSPPVVNSLPSFPNEVVTTILENPGLSQTDLLNCCRVCKHFVALAQPILFRHVYVLCGGPTILEDEERGYVLGDSTKLLLRSLSGNPKLRQYPRKITIDDFTEEGEWESDEEADNGGYYSFSSEFDDPSTPLKRALPLMPKLCAMKVDEVIWRSELVRDVVFNRGQRWKEIDVGGELLTEGNDAREWSALPNIRKVKCAELQHGGLPNRPLPRGLQTLDTSLIPPPIEDPSSPIDSQLRVLHAPLSVDTLNRIPGYQHLQYLSLLQKWGDFGPLSSSTLSNFGTLPSLRFLSICIDHESAQTSGTLSSILRHLPPLLQYLEFPCLVPFNELNAFLQAKTYTCPRVLRLKSSYACAANRVEDLNALTAICLEREIKIEYIEFCEFCRSYIFSL